eukprot:gene12171-12261_t
MTSDFDFETSPVAPFVGVGKGLRFHRVIIDSKCEALRVGDWVLVSPVTEFYRDGMYVDIHGDVSICQKLHSRTDSGERQVLIKGGNGYSGSLVTESVFDDEVAGYVVAVLHWVDGVPALELAEGHLMRGLDMAILGCTLNRQEKSGLSHLSDLALIQITAFIDRMTAKAGETDASVAAFHEAVGDGGNEHKPEWAAACENEEAAFLALLACPTRGYDAAIKADYLLDWVPKAQIGPHHVMALLRSIKMGSLQDETESNPSAIGGASLAAAPRAPDAQNCADAELIRLGQEFAFLRIKAIALFYVAETDEDLDEAHAMTEDVIAKIVAIKAHTLAGLKVKASVVKWFYETDDIEELDFSNETADVSLSFDIARDLIRMGPFRISG